MTVAWVFPGQGSQKLGMAQSVLSLPGALDRFKFASELLGRDLLEICDSKEKPKDVLFDLNDTRNTQPAMFVVESLLVDDLKKQGRKASVLAGHSLGEIVALYAAEVLDLVTALSLIKKRSELMASAGGGSMAAVLGFNREQLESLVEESQGVVIANDNSSSQIVLSGLPEAVEELTQKLTCKRIVPLNVSGAFHSPYMSEAAKSFANELDKVNFADPIFPVISNSDPTPSSDGNLLKSRLTKQMTSGVRWRETMNAIKALDIQIIVEIGPGNVLSGLAKRSLADIETHQISSASDLGN